MEKITLNMTPSACLTTCHASQFDIGRQVRFDLIDGSSAFTLTGAETVTLKIRRADGVTVQNSVPNTSDSYVIWTSVAGECDVAGVSECELSVTDGADVLGSANFLMTVEPDAYDESAIIVREAHGSPAHFDTDIPDNAVECKFDISYSPNGYTSATAFNTSNAPTSDKTPYLLRPSFANGNEYDKLVGGTVAFNQLCRRNKADSSYNGVTYKNNADGTITLTGEVNNSGGSWYALSQANEETIVDHVYYYDISGNTQAEFWQFGYLSQSRTSSAKVYKVTGVNRFGLYVAYGTGTLNETVMANCVDLTQMFGSTIADYIYTLESGTAGAGVAWLKSHGYLTKPYYDYNAGALKSVQTSKHITTGFNQFDISTKTNNNALVWNSGILYSDVKSIVSDYIRVVVGQIYYCNYKAQWCCYDENKEYIGNILNGVLVKISGNDTNSVTIPNGVYYLRLGIRTIANNNEDMTAKTDINLNIHSDLDGQYHPYVKHEYDLSGSRLVHRVFGIVEFDGSADENWQSAGTVGTNYRYYIENVGNIKTNNGCITNYLEPYNDFGHEFGAYRFSTNGTFIIHDKDKTISDVTALKTYLSNNPLQCGYELATPFDETVTNPELRGIPMLDSNNKLYYYGDTCEDFTNPQIVDGNGTEEYIDGRDFEMPVGHETVYGEDMTAIHTDFGATVYGGEYNLTTGVLTSTKNADGTDKNPPDVYNLTPKAMPVRDDDNYVLGTTGGDAYVKYYEKA